MAALFEVYALRYATRMAPASECFLGIEPDEAPRRMDYFVWVAVNDRGTVVVDTGFSAEVARRRGREFLRCPAEALRILDVEPAEVKHVVLSHMHYDHVGNVASFPAATLWMQAAELAFYTGPYAHYPRFSRSIEVEDVLTLVRANYAGRLRLIEGERELVPGLTAYWVGGHTAGQQVVRVQTARGNLVLATDAAHYYEEIEQERPFPTLHDLPGMYRAYVRVNELADSPEHVIPGHDPLVMERYPPVSPESADWLVRLA